MAALRGEVAAKAAEEKKAEEEKAEAAKKAETKKVEAKRSPTPPPPRSRQEQAQPIAKVEASPKPPPSPKPLASRPLRVVESAGCKEFSEAGQKRVSRSTGTYTCTRTRTLLPATKRDEPEPVLAEAKPPEPMPVPAVEDWNTQAPDVSGLAEERAIECLENLCHQRHPNFIKESNDKKAASQRGHAKVGDEGGGKAPPKTGTRTTVKTRKSPPSTNGAGPKNQKKPTSAPGARKPQQPELNKWKEKGGTVRENPDGSRTFRRNDGVEVTYDKEGFPDFSKHRHPKVKDVEIEFTGSYDKDMKLADEAAGITKKVRDSEGYTWHHHQDGKTMQLVKTDVHKEFFHTGGMSGTR